MAVKSLRESRWRVFVLLGALAVGLAAVSESPRARVCATEVNVETKPVSQGGSETSPSRVEAKQEVAVWPMPLPSLEVRQKARKLLEEVYKDQIAKARLPHEKGKLAKEMLDLALDDLDPANQYVLAEEARRLALEAMDRKLVMRAVELLAQFEPVVGKVSAQEAAKRGHTAWAASERLTGKVQLGRQAEAAEWYLRALQGDLSDLEETLVRKRLEELGWQQTFQLAYEFNTIENWKAREDIASFKVRDGILCGEVSGRDPRMYCLDLHLDAQNVRFIEIRMAVSHDSAAQIYWITSESSHFGEDKAIWFHVKGGGRFYVYRIALRAKPTWKGQIIGIRFDPVHWHPYQEVPRDPISFQIDFIRFF